MQSLFEAVRDACPRGLWAKGVKLARDGAVSKDSAADDELVLRVRAPELPVAATVVLYPLDDEWDCDCPSRVDACAHVAAAVIAAQKPDELPSVRAGGREIRYAFVRKQGALHVERYIGDAPMTGDLDGVDATQSDYEIDAVLRMAGSRRLTLAHLVQIVGALDGARDVTLDGKPVYVSGDVVFPLGVVRDEGAGVRLEVVPHPTVTEVVGDGVALCGDTLQPLGHTEITGPQLEKLPFGKTVKAGEYAALVTETIPELERDIPIDIRTTRLPEITTSARPRIDIDVQQGDALSVLPTLVYGTPPIARIDGDAMVHLRGPAPVRDRTAERALLTKLRDELNLVPGRRVEYRGVDAARLTDRLRAWHGGGGAGGEDYVLSAPLLPRVDLSEGFDLSFESAETEDGPPRTASAAAVLGAWESGLDLVPLDGGGWAPLPADWLSKHGDIVVDLFAAREADGSVPRYALPALASLADELDEPLPPSTAAIRTLLEGFEGIAEAPLPDDFTGELRHYQRDGVNWLVCLREAGLGAVLADDMGLGKTIQTLCAIQGRTLVVCPTSVLPTWQREIQRFRPGLTTCVYHGPSRELDDKAAVTITTYALLRIDSKRLADIEWDTVVLDEAQAIKNPQSQVARAAHKLTAAFRVALSGTPVENRLDELWSQFHFVNRGLLGDRSRFHKRYARPIARDEPGAAARLRDRIRLFLLRRLKEDVEPELPPRTDDVIYVELDETERAVYDAIRIATRDDVVARLREGGGVMKALEALLRLRQAACHRGLVPGQEAERSSKIDALLDALDRATVHGHKALVFSQWTSLLDRVEPHLTAAGIDFIRLDGSTRDRGAVVDAFQREGGPPVMLVSLKAGGTGLTLTHADHVFLLDPWWNPAVEDQAADRTHRIGQTRPVMVYRLVAADTVEARILSLQDKKRALADAALGDAGQAASLTRDDLLGLLE